MGRKIHSQNITDISRQAAFNRVAKKPPKIDDLLNNIRRSLRATIKKRSSGEFKDQGKATKAQENLNRLEDLLNNIPSGMTLAVVLYSRGKNENSKGVYKEFRKTVKPAFYKFLAKEHSDDLKGLGLCDYAIKRMSYGLEPASKDGFEYNVNIDHIIERSGSGHLMNRKSKDTLLLKHRTNGQSVKTYEVNHFKNLILLPVTIHDEIKNFINSLQDISRHHPDGYDDWCLMLIPEPRRPHSRYVYVPTGQDKIKHLAHIEKLSAGKKINHINFDFKRLLILTKDFQNAPFIQNLNERLQKVADDRQLSSSDLLRLEREGSNDNEGSKKIPLNIKLSDLITDHAPLETQERYKQILTLTNQMGNYIKLAYEDAICEYKETGSTEKASKIENFLNSSNYKDLLKRLDRIPAKKDGSASSILSKTHEMGQHLSEMLDASEAHEEVNQNRAPQQKRHNPKS